MLLFRTRLWLVIALLCSSLLAATARAEEPPLQQDMPVEDRSSPMRIKASIRGFFEVLTQLSGEELPIAVRREIAGEADNYLQGYRYLARDEQLYLQLYFDREAVQERIARELSGGVEDDVVVTAQPVLLWLGVTQGDLEALLTEGAQGLLPNTLQEVAQALGQPLVLPADDSLARGDVQVEQLRRGNVEPVLRASSHYGMEQVLMGSLSLVEGDQWSATWQIPGAGRQWRSQTATLDAVLDEGLRGYLQLTRAAVLPEGRGYGISDDQVAVSVTGVSNMDDHLWLRQSLATLLGKDKVRAVVVGRGSVLFAVNAAADVAAVQRQLAQLNRISLIPAQFAQSGESQSADLNYMLH